MANYDYTISGFDAFLCRSIASTAPVATPTTLDGVSSVLAQSNVNSIAFDQAQVSGSLGDKIQIGGTNVIIDGTNRRITINDGTVDRVIIGEQTGGF
jgi:hypothetical protein